MKTTLTRAEAHSIVNCIVTSDELRHVARIWDVSGWWNESAIWDVETLHSFIDEHSDYELDDPC